MARAYKRTRVSSQQWHALYTAHVWRMSCPSKATMQALVAKGLMAEGPDPDAPQYHLTVRGLTYTNDLMLDGYFNKDASKFIYPTKGEIKYAVEREIDRRHAMEKEMEHFPSFSDMPYRRTYTTVELEGGVIIRVPVEDVYWDVPVEVSIAEKIDRRIRGETD